MSTELAENMTPQEQFQNNIKDRLQKDIGDLIPDEVLKGMVEKSIKEMFFTRKMDKAGSDWSPKWQENASWFEAEVFDRFKILIEIEVDNEIFELPFAQVASARLVPDM